MIDFNFYDELTNNRFQSRYVSANAYYVGGLRETSIRLLNPKMIPMIRLQGNYTEPKPAHVLMQSSGQQFRNQSLPREKLAEVMNSAHYLLDVKHGTALYTAGKGFLGTRTPNGKITPIMIMTVPDAQYTDNEVSDITMLVSNDLSEQPPAVRALLQAMVTEHPGDIIRTANILKFISGRIQLPKFISIRAKKEFTDTFIDRCVDSL